MKGVSIKAKRRIARAVRPARAVFRKEVGAAVNEAVGPVHAGLEAEVRDLRRILRDDMDASNEATAVFGRLLSQLRDRLDDIDTRLTAMASQIDALEEQKQAEPRTGAGGGTRSRAKRAAPSPPASPSKDAAG